MYTKIGGRESEGPMAIYKVGSSYVTSKIHKLQHINKSKC